jgi:hypothetical protein
MADNVNARITFTPVDELFHNPYMAFKLADGSTDGVLYPTKAEAIRHQSNEYLCVYFSFRRCMAGINRKEAQLFLDMHRHIYDAGGRMTNPEDYIMPQAKGQGLWPM